MPDHPEAGESGNVLAGFDGQGGFHTWQHLLSLDERADGSVRSYSSTAKRTPSHPPSAADTLTACSSNPFSSLLLSWRRWPTAAPATAARSAMSCAALGRRST